MRRSFSDPARVASTLLPIADDRRDWTETASLILTGIGGTYFAIHFVVAAARAFLS